MLPPAFRDKQVCIIGLGYVGLTLAVALAEVGFRVHGVERDQDILAHLARRRAHFSEIGLEAKLADQLERGILTVTSGLPKASGITSYMITVGTPIGPDKRTRSDAIETVARDLAQVLNAHDLVMLRSTVRVGTTRQVIKPILDTAKVPYDLAFCPERTLEGKALIELRTLPQLVGGIDVQSTFRAAQMFSFLTASVVRVSDPESAELIKLVNNTQRDLLFAFANEVAAMCDACKVSAIEVVNAANLGYPRSSVPLPGPVGGPCLEKDPYILAEGLEQFGFIPSLSVAARRWNEMLPVWTVARIADAWRAKASEGSTPKRVAVLGLAFKGKPETDDLRGTPAVDVIARLRAEFASAEVVGFDPVVPPDRIATLGITAAVDIDDAFRASSIVVIQNNHEFFAKMPVDRLARLMTKPGVIYDYWNQANRTQLQDSIGVDAFGLGMPIGTV